MNRKKSWPNHALRRTVAPRAGQDIDKYVEIKLEMSGLQQSAKALQDTLAKVTA